jgi:hypothetical protein
MYVGRSRACNRRDHMKHTLKLSVLVAAGALASAVSLAQQDRSAPSSEPSSPAQSTSNAPVYSGRAITLNGSIESVDRVTQTVQIKAEDGRVHAIRLRNPTNLEDLAKGKKVTARYQEAVLLTIARSDASPQVQSQATQDKPNGGVPAVQEVQHTSVVAQVTDVDREAKRIVLETPNGESIQMGVRDADAIKALKTGDKVVATYIEAFALSIAPEDESSPATARETPPPSRRERQ